MTLSIKIMHEFIAIWALIHGQQMNTGTICKTVAEAHSYLQQKTTGQPCDLLCPHTLISAIQIAPNNPIVDELLHIFGQQSMALIKLSVEMRSLFTALDTTNMSHNNNEVKAKLS